MRLTMRSVVRSVIGVSALWASLVALWTGIEYYNDLQVARRLESDGVPVSWTQFRVSSVELSQVESGERFARVCSQLNRLSRLDKLYLSGGTLTDGDLQLLSGLTSLRRLAVYDLPVDGSGLSYLHGMTRLEWLSLSKTELNDHTFGNVVLFKGLTRLDVKNASVTSKAVSALQELRHLSTLDLSGCDIDDHVVSIVAQMRTIRDLRLNKTSINDDAGEHLSRMKGLRYLWIQDTNITPTGLKRLIRELPDTNIIASQDMYRFRDEKLR